MASLAPAVDWVETHNARVVGRGNEEAAEFALEHGLPGVSVSDAHSIMEVGVAYTALDGDPVDAGRSARRASERGDRPGSRELPGQALDAGRQGRQPGPRQRPGPGHRGRCDVVPRGRSVSDPLGHDHRPMVEGAARSGTVRCDGGDPDRGPRDRASRARLARRRARDRTDRGRPDLARAAAPPAADDPVDRGPARRSSRSSCTSTASAWQPSPR